MDWRCCCNYANIRRLSCIVSTVPFLILDFDYDQTSVNRAKEFLENCRSLLGSDSNFLWAAFQSNLLCDVDGSINDEFKSSFPKIKKTLLKEGWILPRLHYNMRNQVNISNINITKGYGKYETQSSIEELGSGSSVVGQVPTRLTVLPSNWDKKSKEVMKYCIEKMEKKNNKNIVILHNCDSIFEDIESILTKIINNKTIISYPSRCKNKETSINNVISFSQQVSRVLITNNK